MKKIVAAIAGLTLTVAIGTPTWADMPTDIGVATSPAPPLSAQDKHQFEAESKEGEDASAEVNKTLKLSTDPALINRVTRIGEKLAAIAVSTTTPAEFGNDHAYPFTYRFFVVDSPEVNAFSLPGGYIYVNTGLLKAVRSDDELAGVLGHEITHADHHHVDTIQHIVNTHFTGLNIATMAAMLAAILSHSPDSGNAAAGIATVGQYGEMGIVNNTYSEQAERDADHGGTLLMQKAGYNPVAMLTFMERLGDFEDRGVQFNEGVFENHPPAPERIALITHELAEMHVDVTPKSVRTVSGGFHATVSPGAPGTEILSFGKQTVTTLADPNGTRAQAAASLLNTLLDSGLQPYQIFTKDSVLLADDHPLVQFTSADAALTPGSTPQTLASQADDNLQKGLWAQSFVVASP